MRMFDDRYSREAAQRLPGLGRGELLCQGYDSYRALVGTPLISFEHAVFLITALARGDELTVGACGACHAMVVAERWSFARPALHRLRAAGPANGVAALTARHHIQCPVSRALAE